MADGQPEGHGHRTPFARGGPIYVPNLVGPITTVPEFKVAAVRELQCLEEELCASDDFEEELSVDDLKVLTEEELVEKALKEDFEVADVDERASQAKQYSNEKGIPTDNDSDGFSTSLNEIHNMECSRSVINSSNSSSQTHDKLELVKGDQQAVKKRKKRGRTFDRDSRAAALEGSYFAKVEQLAKLMQKQNEDKAAARLQSFNGNSKPLEGGGTTATSEKIERMRALRFIIEPLPKVNLPVIMEHMPISYPEVVLSIEIYTNGVTLQKTQEFLVVGTQHLTELRDQIYCLTDKLMWTAGEYDPSGYFLIEDFFYNDLRDPSAIDYSKPILDWLRNSKCEAEEKWDYIMSGELKKKQKELFGNSTISNLPSLKAVDMHKTRFCDLQFRLGAGYLYCHQGDCKHVLVVRDMRLIHPEDVQNMAAYPIRTFQTKLRHRKCSVCKIYMATRVTVDDKWAQKNPCYFCDNCYYLLHYNEDGSLLYNDFTVYDYHHE